MLEYLLDNFRTVLIGGILLVIGISQVNRILGSALGILFWCGLGLLGREIYARGGSVGLLDFAFPPVAFYTLCAFMVVVNLFILRQKLAAGRRRRAREEAPPEP